MNRAIDSALLYFGADGFLLLIGFAVAVLALIVLAVHVARDSWSVSQAHSYVASGPMTPLCPDCHADFSDKLLAPKSSEWSSALIRREIRCPSCHGVSSWILGVPHELVSSRPATPAELAWAERARERREREQKILEFRKLAMLASIGRGR